MKYIRVRKANCKNCYKCLKNCMIKSIKVKDDKVSVIDEQCILCGRCVKVCPQNAKQINNDPFQIVDYLKNPNIRTVASVAPSYISAFGESSKKFITALKILGFDEIEETAIGASMVTAEYKKLIDSGKMRNIITSCCPTVNMLITMYYPELTDMIAPVLSPVLAHGKAIKEKNGNDTKVIFIGPCLSKIKEINDNKQYVDGVLTFNQISNILENELGDINELNESNFDKNSSYSRIYPIADGILFDIDKLTGLDSDKTNYNFVSVSGLEDVKELLDEIKDGHIQNVFAEVNACNGGCINGPLMPQNKENIYKSRFNIEEYAKAAEFKDYISDIEITNNFKPESIQAEIPTDEEIRSILRQIGKYTEEQELNCGSCGYPTCREKAIAVYQKKAELYMCLPYMTDINQTMSNVTLTVTPNYIIAVDENMLIKEFNVAAQKLFQISRNDALNKPLFEYIDTSDFEKVIKTKNSIYDKKVKYNDLNITTNQTIVYSEENNIAIAFIKDITKEEELHNTSYKMKLESVEMAQKVIDKQMMVAQQIASLLGETTAETKVTLNKLKNLIANEGLDYNE